MQKENTTLSVIDRHVGRQLRLTRMANKFTQNEVAAHLEVTIEELKAYEAGERRLCAPDMWRLCQLFDVQAHQFFKGLSQEQ